MLVFRVFKLAQSAMNRNEYVMYGIYGRMINRLYGITGVLSVGAAYYTIYKLILERCSLSLLQIIR